MGPLRVRSRIALTACATMMLLCVSLLAGVAPSQLSSLSVRQSSPGSAVAPISWETPALSGHETTTGASGTAATETSAYYDLNFTESGLPSGSVWGVGAAGASPVFSNTKTITLNVSEGKHSFVVVPIPGYYPSKSSPSVNVTGPGIVVRIAFSTASSFTYAVDFVELGAPNGAPWSVTFNGTTSVADGSMITFQAGNGTWPYGVPTVLTSTPSPSSGNVTVSGGTVTVYVQFTTPSVLGLPPALAYALIVFGAVLLLLLIGALVVLRRLRRGPFRPRGPSPATTAPTQSANEEP